MNIEIRRFVDEDAEAVSNIFCRNFLEAYTKSYDYVYCRHMADYYDCATIKWYGSKRTHMYVAANGGILVGCGAVTMRGEACIIDSLFTLPEHHGRGVGSAVIKVLEADEYALNCGKCLLFATLHARGFYIKMGYDDLGIVTRNGIEEHKMEKCLEAV